MATSTSGPRQQVDARMAASPPAKSAPRPFCGSDIRWPFEFGLDSVTLLPYSCTESSDMENNLENLTIGVLPRRPGSTWRQSASISARACCGTGQALRQHPPLWGGGRGSGEIREIGTAAGVQSGRDCRAVAARRWHPLRGGQQPWPNTKLRTCARRWPTWRAWKPCCLNSCAPAMHERGMFPPVDRVTTGRSRPRQGQLCLSVLYLMRWSLPPSQYYAEDRLFIRRTIMENIALIGIDLGKNSFHIHCQDHREGRLP